MVRACSESAPRAPVTGIAHQQLVGDVLQIVQGRRRICAFGQREVDQCGLASYGRTILQLSGQIAPGGCDALLAFHQSGQRQHGRDAAMLFVFGALPPAVLNFLFAERYRQEPQRVASIVLIGNLAALIFLPLALAWVL